MYSTVSISLHVLHLDFDAFSNVYLTVNRHCPILSLEMAVSFRLFFLFDVFQRTKNTFFLIRNNFKFLIFLFPFIFLIVSERFIWFGLNFSINFLELISIFICLRGTVSILVCFYYYYWYCFEVSNPFQQPTFLNLRQFRFECYLFLFGRPVNFFVC